MDYSVLTTGLSTGVLESGSRLVDLLLGASAGPLDAPAGWGYFAFIYDYVRHEIKALGFNLVVRGSYYASLIALALVTMWVFYQGIRIFMGKGDSMMALVVNASRVAFIVTAAIAMGTASSAMYDTVGVRLPGVITGYVTNSTDTIEEQVDDNLFAMTVALKSIDALNVVTDPDLQGQKERALYMTAIGTAGPAVTAGAMLLFYQAALALFIGLGPFFILCLIFDQTKSLFTRWLMYGIGTMFSMAILSAMVSIALKAVLAVTASHWATAAVGGLLGLNLTSGINAAAMEQGGIGILLTLLIITVPPMAANFFQGTLGQFASYGQVSGGGAAAANQQSRYENATGQGGGQQQPVSRNTGGQSADNTVRPGVPTAGPTTVVGGGGGQGIGAAADKMKVSSSAPTSTVTPTSRTPETLAADYQRSQKNDGGDGVG